MRYEQGDLNALDLEAFADGNLSEADARSMDTVIRARPSYLSSIFGLARINSAIRKSRRAAYRDQELSERIQELRAQHRH